MKKIIYIALLFLIRFPMQSDAQANKEKLMRVLGIMPKPPALKVDTLERTRLLRGWRYRIRFLAEDSSTYFHTPQDFIHAYLFVPDHPGGKKLPAIIAIHQDGSHNYIGYLETAGLAGDADQYYGLELYKRGYMVICPDRFLHGPRRHIPHPDTLSDDGGEADRAEEHWTGQLLLAGRCMLGKEVYDMTRTMDVLYSIKDVDRKHIGVIGHSAGGHVLGYYMFADPRVRVGVSSCGVFEMADWYDENAIRKRDAAPAIPRFLLAGRTSDFIGYIAPRPFLMTRGLYEWGNGNAKEQADSKSHVTMTQQLEKEAMLYYHAKHADSLLKTIYFEENGGQHSFPPKVKEQVYQWLDHYLKP